MNTTDSAKVSDANAGANNVVHIPHNPTLTGLGHADPQRGVRDRGR